jgi:hypothetical protein
MNKTTPNTESVSGSRPLWPIVVAGIVLTFASNVATFVLLITLAPRRQEGIRSVVDLPWEPYVALAHVAPLAFVYISSHLWFHTPRDRIIVMLTAAVTMYLWFNYHQAHLLRRHFIGKF